MKSCRNSFFLLLITLSLCCLAPAGQLFADENASTTISSQSDIDSMMAGLSDEQVRKMLIEELKNDVTATQLDETHTLQPKFGGPSGFFNSILNSLINVSQDSENQYGKIFAAIPKVMPALGNVFLKLCPVGSSHGAITNFLWILLFVTIGFFIEFLFAKIVLARRCNAKATISEKGGFLEKLGAGVANQLPAVIGIFIFVFGAYLANLFMLGTDLPFVQLVFLSILICIVWVRLTSIVSKIIISPDSQLLRIVPLHCPLAHVIQRFFVFTSGYLVSFIMFAIVIKRLGGEQKLYMFVLFLAATILLFITAMVILFNRQKVQDYIMGGETASNEVSWTRRRFAAIWHFLAILYLLVLWMLLVNNLGDPSHKSGGGFILSFFAVPIWFVLDKVGQWVVSYGLSVLFLSDAAIPDGELTEEYLEKKENEKKTKQRIHTFVRGSIMLAVVTWIATLWDIELPILAYISHVLVDGIIIAAVALVFWKFISDWIQRKIDESTPEADEEEEDNEWGGAASRGRSYTLLPMLRKFVGTILFVMVVMTLLSEMGVNIGPLLAGAGVVGLAVGFGAQKLVADVFSGFFYLLDDAFRVGEYLEAGNVTGTVENISLRNIFLRHHRGMLQIVPHSELGAITNFMRGGMVVKFNLDFPYDANIDKIRKIIKKVGVAMLEDPDIGDGFIKQVKSQGVREITNSVMTIRVKFTAHPGKHFLIRREAYKRITEALNAQGIYYAHRKVIVDLPDLPQNLGQEEQKKIVEAAGAAAQQTIQSEEQTNPQSETTK